MDTLLGPEGTTRGGWFLRNHVLGLWSWVVARHGLASQTVFPGWGRRCGVVGCGLVVC
jgi:hypothetical protein